MRFLSIVITAALLVSCSTVDMERKVKPSSSGGALEKAGKGNTVVAVPVDHGPREREIIVIEKPVYVPEKTPVPPAKNTSGQQAVLESNAEGIKKPSDYSKGAMVYDYDPDFVYEVYVQPMRAVDIILQSGERIMEAPFISDSARWMLGAGKSMEGTMEIQHVYVKPVAASLEASLIINTDRRVYHIVLRSFQAVNMPMVRWNYPANTMPNSFISDTPPSVAGVPAPVSGTADAVSIDPKFLSFDYRIRYGFFSKPRWLPELVYDDGRKTYITFPKDVLQSEMPAVWENRADVVNYRVYENSVIIDKRIEKVTVKIGNREIVIEKKGAKR